MQSDDLEKGAPLMTATSIVTANEPVLLFSYSVYSMPYNSLEKGGGRSQSENRFAKTVCRILNCAILATQQQQQQPLETQNHDICRRRREGAAGQRESASLAKEFQGGGGHNQNYIAKTRVEAAPRLALSSGQVFASGGRRGRGGDFEAVRTNATRR